MRAARAPASGSTPAAFHLIEEALEAGTLTTLLDDFEPPAWPVSLVTWPGRVSATIKLRAFLDFAAPRLKARLLQ